MHGASKRALQVVLTLGGIATLGIALAHIAFGPVVIPGHVPVNATMDSEDRFYATIFLGYGAAQLWCAQQIERRLPVVQFILAVLFLGGLARLVSIALVGAPNPFFQVMAALELVLPLALWPLQMRVAAEART